MDGSWTLLEAAERLAEVTLGLMLTVGWTVATSTAGLTCEDGRTTAWDDALCAMGLMEAVCVGGWCRWGGMLAWGGCCFLAAVDTGFSC